MVELPANIGPPGAGPIVLDGPSGRATPTWSRSATSSGADARPLCRSSGRATPTWSRSATSSGADARPLSHRTDTRVRSVLVVVSVVGSVPVTVVDVVDVITVRDRDMTAALTVDVLVRSAVFGVP